MQYSKRPPGDHHSWAPCLVLTSDALQETLLFWAVVAITKAQDLSMVLYVRAYADTITANVITQRDLSWFIRLTWGFYTNHKINTDGISQPW